MIRYLTILALLHLHIVGALSQVSRLNSLDTFSANLHSGDEFSDHIQTIQKEIKKTKDYDSFVFLESYLSTLDAYDFDDIHNLRITYARQGLYLYQYTAEIERAKLWLLKAHHVKSLEQIRNDPSAYNIENLIAVIYNILGDKDNSLYFYELTEDALINLKDNRISQLLGNKGILLKSTGDLDKAMNCFIRGIHLAKRDSNFRGFANNQIYLCDLYIQLDQPEQAKLQLDSLQPLFVHKEIKQRLFGAYLENQAKLLEMNDQLDASIKTLNQLTHFYDTTSSYISQRVQAKHQNHLAKLLLKRDDFKNSKKHVRLGLKILFPDERHVFVMDSNIYLENTIMDLYSTLSRTYMMEFEETSKSTYLDSALMSSDYALVVNEKLVSQYEDDESKYQESFYNREELNHVIKILYNQQENGHEISRDELLSYIERAKGQVFDQAMKKRIALDELSANQQKQYIANSLRIAQLNQKDSSLSIEMLNEKLTLTRVNNEALQNPSEELPYLESHFKNYILTDAEVFAVHNFDETLKIELLCERDRLDSETNKLLSSLENHQQSPFDSTTSRHIFDLLFNPIDNIPPQFSVIGDGIINRIPFDMLISSNGRMLVFDHLIDYRLSMKTRPSDQKRFENAYCIVPSYGKENQIIAHTRGEIYPLRFADTEYKNITTHFPQSQKSNLFDLKAYAKIIQSNDIFHYAGHAKVTPDYSMLIINENEDIIAQSEIAALPSTLDLAVLSACETGLGKVEYSEGTLSLARAFISTGTKEVINSLWTVNDQSTAELMKYFYKNLKKTDSPKQALRSAKLEYLAQEENEALHPYHWAGFVLTTAEVSQTKAYPIGLLITLAIILISTIIYLKFIKK